MPYAIEFTASARREFTTFPVNVQTRVAARIYALADNPHPHGVKKLSGLPNHFRIRIGDYRVIYRIHGDMLVVVIVGIGHRRDVYRRWKHGR